MSLDVKTLSLELVQESLEETTLYEREHYSSTPYKKISVYKVLGSLETSDVDELTDLFRKIMNLLPFSTWALLSKERKPTSYFEIIKSDRSNTYYYIQHEYTSELPWQTLTSVDHYRGRPLLCAKIT